MYGSILKENVFVRLCSRRIFLGSHRFTYRSLLLSTSVLNDICISYNTGKSALPDTLAETGSEVITFQINKYISFQNSLFMLDLCYNRILILTKVMISHPKTPSI